MLGVLYGCAGADLSSSFLQPISHPSRSHDSNVSVYTDDEQGICNRGGLNALTFLQGFC
jgi:hypothetical protein